MHSGKPQASRGILGSGGSIPDEYRNERTLMSLYVHKYGGSSVADAEKIVNVARRIAAVHEQGHQIVTVVSAMGDTTDELIDLARTVSNEPDPRELDFLLSTGELVSITLLSMALRKSGLRCHQPERTTGGYQNRQLVRTGQDQ